MRGRSRQLGRGTPSCITAIAPPCDAAPDTVWLRWEALIAGTTAWREMGLRRRAAAYPKAPDYLTASTAPSPQPPRKHCIATGLPAAYCDPNSVLGFADVEAFQHVQSQIPPWASVPQTKASFFDVMRKTGEAQVEDREYISKLKSEAWRRRVTRS